MSVSLGMCGDGQEGRTTKGDEERFGVKDTVTTLILVMYT